MNLPPGVSQDSACVLIAMREFFNDPTWEDADLIQELRSRNGSSTASGQQPGYPVNKIPEMCKRAGLFSPDFGMELQVYSPSSARGSNADEIYVLVNKTLIYAFPRTASSVFTYWTNKDVTHAHAICVPIHIALCFIFSLKYEWAHIAVDQTHMRFLGVKTG